MLCPFCEFENPSNHIYCGRCGRNLSSTGSLTAQADTLQGERKQVTVMFADISGFTAMSEDRDPEEVVTLVNACLAHLSECVYRYDGTIDKYIGDAIMAVFGAPRAHEDDPERAIRAALDMKDAMAAFKSNPPLPLSGPLDIHVGISTGNVVVGQIGTKRHQDYTVMGDAANLASRLEDLSDRGQIFVGEGTYRFTSRLFVFREMKPTLVKGRTEPIKMYEVIGARKQPGSMRGLSGLRYPLVGREKEVRRFSRTISRLKSGQGGIVLVEGDAGIGKSRLVAEVRDGQGDLCADVMWLEGRGLSYGYSRSYHLPAGVLRHYMGVSEEEDETRVWLKLRSTSAALFGPRADELRPYLAMLLGLRLSESVIGKISQANPQQLQQQLFSAFGEWAKAVSTQKPLVLAFDDMHWADPNSMALMEYLIALCQDQPILVLCVSRPDRESPFWRIRQRAIKEYAESLVHIRLYPLQDSQILNLVDSLLNVESLPPELEHTITSRAEGNPLFVEEMLRTFIDEGTLIEENGHWRAASHIQSLVIPDTLQGMLTARIDRLDDATKRIVQIAAVVGRVFLRSVLARVVDDPAHLDEGLILLQDSEIIRERSRDPEPEYIFKHILTQEAAYRSLLAQQRRVYHRRVADALARLFWERGEEYAGASLVAAHYERAEAWPRALRYLERAGDGARTGFSYQEAVNHYTQALRIADLEDSESTPAQRLALYEKRGNLLPTLGNVQAGLADYQKMCDLARGINDTRAELRALNQIGALHSRLGEPEKANDNLNEALRLAQSIGDQAGISESLNRLGSFHRSIIQYEEARTYHQQALQITHTLDDKSLLATSLEGLAQVDLLQGRLQDSQDKYTRIIDLRRRLVDQVGLMQALNALAIIYTWQAKYQQAENVCLEGFDFINLVGDLPIVSSLHVYFAISHLNRGHLEVVEEHLTTALEVARRVDSLPMQIQSLRWLGYYFAVVGQLDDALKSAQDAFSLAQSLSSPLWQVRSGACLGMVRITRGELEQSFQFLQELYQVAKKVDFAPDRAVTLYNLAQAGLELGKLEVAGKALDELFQISDELELGEYQLRGRWLRGKLALALGNLEGAQKWLGESRSYGEAIGGRLFLWQVEAAMGDVLRTAGRDDEAQSAYTRAWEIVQSVIDTLPRQSKRDTMLNCSPICELYAKLVIPG